MSTILNIHRDGTPFSMGTTHSRVLVSPAMGARHVTFNYIRYEPHAEFPQHLHDHSEDVFLVLEGTGWFREGDKRTPIGPGDVVFIPAGEVHGTVAGPDGMVVVSCQGPPDAKLYSGERDSSRAKQPSPLEIMNLAPRIADLRPTAVNQVLQEVHQLQREGRELVSLMRGQPDSPTPPHIVAAAAKALRDGRTGYPDNLGEPALRQAVAAKLHRQHGTPFDPDKEILITDGATGGLFTALGALIQPGDDVLLPDPIYDAYLSPIALWGGRPVPVRSGIRAGRFRFDRDSLQASCTSKARAILLNTPWNPVGAVLTTAELQELLAFAAERNLYVISDEIYETLVYDGKTHVSPIQLAGAARERMILVNSLSKTYAMTGWRVGYCAAPAEVIQAMLLLWQQFSRGPATFVQDAAACALNGDQECVRKMTAEYQQRRDLVMGHLRRIRNVEPLVPEGGLFVMVDVRGLGMPSDQVRRVLLREHGVVVIHGSAYGPSGEGTLRVSFAAGGETLARGLERLRDGLTALSAGKERI